MNATKFNNINVRTIFPCLSVDPSVVHSPVHFFSMSMKTRAARLYPQRIEEAFGPIPLYLADGSMCAAPKIESREDPRGFQKVKNTASPSWSMCYRLKHLSS